LVLKTNYCMECSFSAYNLIDMGHDTVSANLALGHPEDARNYQAACAILEDLGISKIKLLTNNPKKIKELEQCGITIVDRIEMTPLSWTADTYTVAEDRDGYLITKAQRMGHLLDIPELVKSLSRENSLRDSDSEKLI
jgi:GTP cyclohydrolase II